MKKILSIILAAAITAALFTGCGNDLSGTAGATDETPYAEYELSQPLNIAALKGPTGIGMTYLFDMKDIGYNMQLFEAPDQVTAKLISGEMDVAAVPSNLGSVLYNKTGGEIVCLAINTGSTLYIVNSTGEEISSVKDLAGKTVYASGKGSVPEYVLDNLIIQTAAEGVEVQWLASHTDVISTVLAKEGGAIGLLPEPHVTIAKSKSDAVKVAIDLGAEWKNIYNETLPMGILAARKSVISEREEDIERLLKACAYSTDMILEDTNAAAAKVAELEIVPSAEIAKSVIPNCGIMFNRDSESVKGILSNFYEILNRFSPQALGGALPQDDYYYSPENK